MSGLANNRMRRTSHGTNGGSPLISVFYGRWSHQEPCRGGLEALTEVSIHWPFSNIFMTAPLPEPTVELVMAKLQESGVSARHYSERHELTDAGYDSQYVQCDDVFVVDAAQEALARTILGAALDEQSLDGMNETFRKQLPQSDAS